MASVTLQSVRKVYGNGHVAVDSADFTVEDGELLVLVGPSGCGKSTVLRMIAGLEEVTRGRILIADRDVTQLPPRERDIAMVFQSYALYPHMSVQENLGFGLKLRGHTPEDIAQRVAKAAQTLELSSMLQRRPRELSGGQRQRVALGRALVRHPKVFLLDEPLSNLDAKLRASMRTEIARLHRSLATTMIYVTHDQVEAMTLGQRIVVMDKGVVQQIDAPMKIYERPVNLFVAGFLGNPSMNQFRGRVRDDGAAVESEGAVLPIPPAPTLRGREIVVGVRPEDVRRVDEPEAPHSIRLTATVELIEAVGNEAFVHARLGSWPLIVRCSPHILPESGAQLSLHIAPERMHFFAAQTGERL
ncbi:MAG TPA: sn-glycerol-3-phosphate ABC transporter ATP-binding protein UgpC [Steroidobacter sp.]|jgi:multiple sugar transport system ATP-binding protein|nr:sn-glycerol-3-phosphate ABC transporter ATP-binding protein UgpC [Steroidobacter sp.]